MRINNVCLLFLLTFCSLCGAAFRDYIIKNEHDLKKYEMFADEYDDEFGYYDYENDIVANANKQENEGLLYLEALANSANVDVSHIMEIFQEIQMEYEAEQRSRDLFDITYLE